MIKNVPRLNSEIYSTKYGKLLLVKKVSSGGEGCIYLTSNKLICKIYNKNKLSIDKLEKLKLMLNISLNNEKGICMPLDIVYDLESNFVGYLMNQAEGITMQTCIFVKPLLIKTFPNWKRKELVTLCLTILEKINVLHKNSIIIGDINPLNIIVKNEKEIFFVDTDSYQVDKYPCPVGTINFTAPEIQGKDFKSFLREDKHEYFAVATLLFMILFPGKPPYSQQGGEHPGENIKKHDFPYPLGDVSIRKAPEGPWRFIWSNLPYNIKNKFYQVFKNNERISTSEWIKIMKQYLQMIERKRASDELFPTFFKILDPINVNCSECGEQFIGSKKYIEELKSKSKSILCKDCNSTIILTCARCRKTFRTKRKKALKIDKENKRFICGECRKDINKKRNS